MQDLERNMELHRYQIEGRRKSGDGSGGQKDCRKTSLSLSGKVVRLRLRERLLCNVQCVSECTVCVCEWCYAVDRLLVRVPI